MRKTYHQARRRGVRLKTRNIVQRKTARRFAAQNASTSGTRRTNAFWQRRKRANGQAYQYTKLATCKEDCKKRRWGNAAVQRCVKAIWKIAQIMRKGQEPKEKTAQRMRKSTKRRRKSKHNA